MSEPSLKGRIQFLAYEHEIKYFDDLQRDHPEFLEEAVGLFARYGQSHIQDFFDTCVDEVNTLAQELTRSFIDSPTESEQEILAANYGKQTLQLMKIYVSDTIERFDLNPWKQQPPEPVDEDYSLHGAA